MAFGMRMALRSLLPTPHEQEKIRQNKAVKWSAKKSVSPNKSRLFLWGEVFNSGYHYSNSSQQKNTKEMQWRMSDETKQGGLKSTGKDTEKFLLIFVLQCRSELTGM